MTRLAIAAAWAALLFSVGPARADEASEHLRLEAVAAPICAIGDVVPLAPDLLRVTTYCNVDGFRVGFVRSDGPAIAAVNLETGGTQARVVAGREVELSPARAGRLAMVWRLSRPVRDGETLAVRVTQF